MAAIAGVEMLGVDDLPSDHGRWLIHGPQGGGKTSTASTIAKLGPCLFIDMTGEKGVRSFQKAPYAGMITIVRPKSITLLDDIFWELNKGTMVDPQGRRFESVVLDSLTGAQKMTNRFILGYDETAVREIKKGAAPADMRSWGQSLDVMSDIATFWYGLADGDRDHPIHVVMTSQTKVIDDEVQMTTTRSPDVQKGALTIIKSTPDYIVYCEEEENPEAVLDETLPKTRHIMRFGGHPGYGTKARVPMDLRNKLPSIIGRGKNPPDLAELSKHLRIGGVPVAPTAAPVKAA